MTLDPLAQSAADAVQTAGDVTKTGLKLAETAVKKAWTMLEAAVEKPVPSEYLSEKGIRSIQGKIGGQ